MRENRTAIQGKVEELPSDWLLWSHEWLTARLGYPPTKEFVRKVVDELQRYESIIVLIPKE